jgi:hypothetical protein
MEHELKKPIKKTLKNISTKKRWGVQEIRELLLEIFVIFISITLSLWFHNWNERRHHQTEAKEFIKDISVDILWDIKNLKYSENELNKIIIAFSDEAKLISDELRKKLDTLVKKDKSNFPLILTSVHCHAGTYSGFKSSGKLGYIEDKSLRDLILEYYEYFIPRTLEMENRLTDKMNELPNLFEIKNGTFSLKDERNRLQIDFLIMLAKQTGDFYKELENVGSSILYYDKIKD